MSLQFNDTATKKGIIQSIERKLFGSANGAISSDTNRLKDFTARVNIALDMVYAFIFKCGGTWKFDDSNHDDDPIIYMDLVQGQRTYYFDQDEQGNLILDISKAFIKDNTVYQQLAPVDVETEGGTTEFTDGLNAEGVAGRYDKFANGIELDFVPESNVTDGLKLYISREGSYFQYTNTDKKPGFAGLYHDILALIVACDEARDKVMNNYTGLERAKANMFDAIELHYTRRDKDDRPALSARIICSE